MDEKLESEEKSESKEEKKTWNKTVERKRPKIKGGENFVRMDLKRGYKPGRSVATNYKAQRTWKRNANFKEF